MSTHEPTTSFDERSPPSLRSFGMTFVLVFAVIGLWPTLRHGAQPYYWLLAVACAFLAAALAAPRLLGPLNRLWHAIGLALHRIVGPLVLGILFLAVVTPVALAMRLAGRRLVPTTFDASAATYWLKRDPPGPAPASISNQF